MRIILGIIMRIILGKYNKNNSRNYDQNNSWNYNKNNSWNYIENSSSQNYLLIIELSNLKFTFGKWLFKDQASKIRTL